MNETHYREEIQHLTQWCSNNNLVLITSKTKEVIVDYRRSRRTSPHPRRRAVERVNNIKFLGIHITSDLTWSMNAAHLTSVLAFDTVDHHILLLRMEKLLGIKGMFGAVVVGIGTAGWVRIRNMMSPLPGSPAENLTIKGFISRMFLQAGKHVCVEYPMSMNYKAAVELWDLAQEQGLGNGGPVHSINAFVLQELLTHSSHMRSSIVALALEEEPRANRTSIWSHKGSEDLILVPNGSQATSGEHMEGCAAPQRNATPHHY
ncbi:hypothetical protein L3Q82_006331 [Scortum barcoo]|uniref:Uncharacterized protein n=1 Tax=Scortum barcoo TaxID=214431 RepID=A0ACB8X448_9TELE|nr:hypothetical protein L3Q82_006331 [Scortum barcoo]